MEALALLLPARLGGKRLMLPASFERAFVVGVLVYIAKAGWQFLTGWM